MKLYYPILSAQQIFWVLSQGCLMWLESENGSLIAYWLSCWLLMSLTQRMFLSLLYHICIYFSGLSWYSAISNMKSRASGKQECVNVKDFHKILRKQGVCNSDKAWHIIKKAFVRPNTYSEVSICSNQRHRKRLYLDSLVLLCVKCNSNIYVVMRSKWDRIWNSLEKKHVIQLYKGQVTKTIQSRLY